MRYLISKKEHSFEVIDFEYENIQGYKVSPKNKLKEGISVDSIFIVNKNLIVQLLKKKIRIMLEKLDIDDEDSSDVRKALGNIQRYRKRINSKYKKYLDKKYVSLLNQKMDILERDYKNDLLVNYEKKMEMQYQIQDEIEEKETRRTR